MNRSLSLLSILSSNSPSLLSVAIVFGVLSGICNTLVIPLLFYSLEPAGIQDISLSSDVYTAFNSPRSTLALLFVLNCLLVIIFRILSSSIVDWTLKGTITSERERLYNKINRIPIASIQKLGQSKLINILSVDMPEVYKAVSKLPSIWVASVTAVGLMVYLIYLNSLVFLATATLVVLGVLLNQLLLGWGLRSIRLARNEWDQIQECVKGLILGAKELKLSASKSRAFIDVALMGSEKRSLNSARFGGIILIVSTAVSSIILFVLVGVSVYHFPYKYSLSNGDVLSIFMTVIYLVGPITTIIEALPQLGLGRIAIKKIRELDRELEECGDSGPEVKTCDSITIENLEYRYGTDAGFDTFKLSPVSLSLHKGTVTFIVGGNGSGKSTLAKMLTHHYLPSSGRIYYDGTEITDKNRNSARAFVSAIYSDFFVFRELYGALSANEKVQAGKYLEYLELDKKVSLDECDPRDLSDGQRRRLALLVALLEDRNFYLFDEWAADQDPRFKKIFYERILADLKSQNKIVVAITHDDRFFYCADQLVYMEDGQLIKIESNIGRSNRSCSINEF